MSDPVNLAINVGEKVHKEIGLDFKMKSMYTGWIILIQIPDHGFCRKLVPVYSYICYTATYTCTCT